MRHHFIPVYLGGDAHSAHQSHITNQNNCAKLDDEYLLPKLVDTVNNQLAKAVKHDMDHENKVRCPWTNTDEIFHERQVQIIRMGLKESQWFL